MTLVGDGPDKQKAQAYIEKHQLPITMVGILSQSDVREYMRRSDIMLCTSSRGEGWGAVINEAMNSGCCVICSAAAGATETLIRDGKNGFIFCTQKELIEKLQYAIQEVTWRMSAGENAYHTVIGVWNANTAAEELQRLIVELENGALLTKKMILRPIDWGAL